MIKAIVFDLDDTLYDCLHENDKAVDDTVRYVANELLQEQLPEKLDHYLQERYQSMPEQAREG